MMQSIEDILCKYNIDTIFIHYLDDLNQDHIETSKLCLTAARHCKNIFYYQSNMYLPPHQFTPTYFVNISNFIEIDLFKKYNLNYYYCDNINEEGCVNFIKQCEPDIIIQSVWSQKFSEKIFNIPKYACIGEHPAPLPKGRGAAVLIGQ